MSKHNTTGSRPPRKRRKGGGSYATIDLDAPDGASQEAEDVRVWNISMSEKTGRVSATRKSHKHFFGSLRGGLCEEPETHVDPEPNELPLEKSVAKCKRVRAVKENDSVRPISTR